MNRSKKDFPEERYMERALQLASHGEGFVSPNPMVGAVIVSPDGRIIGEGWHRCYGGPHAEVNAVASVKEEDKALFPECTMYVTLEPCSHFGKTPPCANLLRDCGFRRVVVACEDPNPKVSGRGLRKLREAGIEVEVGMLREEARHLNRRFMTAHEQGRPWIQLKWAQSADGFIASLDEEGRPRPVAFSSPLSAMWMHRERASVDAIMVGTNTANTDDPSLTVRHWPCRHNPAPVTFDVHGHLRHDLKILQNPETVVIRESGDLEEACRKLYREKGITSLMVEGGAALLESFVEKGLYDEVRVETAPLTLGKGLPVRHSLPLETAVGIELQTEKERLKTYKKGEE